MPAPTQPPKVTFVRLSEMPKVNEVNVLYYGGSGTGKTWFLGTAGSRTLFIDTGDGTAVLKSKLFKEKVGADLIVASIREKVGPRGHVEIAEGFDLVCDVIDHALTTFPGDFDTIACDDLTALRKLAMNKGLEVNQATGKSKTKQTVANRFDLIIPAVQDYGIEMNLIEQFLSNYITIIRNAGKNFIVAAHQRYTFESKKGIGEAPVIKEIRPALTGAQFPDTVTAMFDNVWHAERVGGGDKGTVYRAVIHGDEQTVAKTRHAGVFGTVEVNPNFTSMLARIRAV